MCDSCNLDSVGFMYVSGDYDATWGMCGDRRISVSVRVSAAWIDGCLSFYRRVASVSCFCLHILLRIKPNRAYEEKCECPWLLGQIHIVCMCIHSVQRRRFIHPTRS